MSKYNLIDEQWIPVLRLDGSRDELGIKQVLLQAENIAAIEDPSPLVTASLHRFLLAVLYRALEGPCHIDEAKTLFRDGFPKVKIESYLEKWRERFWLFDERFPFGQNPGFQPKSWRAWTALAAEHNADNAKVLFDHVMLSSAGGIPFNAAARWILSTQAFSVSSGKSEIAHTGTAPSAGSLMTIPIGRTLRDTLLYCLVPQNRDVYIDDLPLWERPIEPITFLETPIQVTDKKTGNPKNRSVERIATGFVDMYTWRSRTILLRETNGPEVVELGFASGMGYCEAAIDDPMVPHAINDKKDELTKQTNKTKQAMHIEDRGIWRDYDSLLPDNTHLAPKVIEHAVGLTNRIAGGFPKGILVIGQRYYPPRPNLAFWRKEFFILPQALGGDGYIRQEIHGLLEEANDAGEGKNSLRSACNLYARHLLSRGERVPEKKDIFGFTAQLNSLSHFWSILESKFHEILRDYTIDRDPFEIRHNWLIAMRSALSAAWKLHENSIAGSDAWAIRSFVKADKIIAIKISELNKQIQLLKEVP